MTQPTPWREEISVQAGFARLDGMLEVPGFAPAVVLFAHGSGSSRFSPRNNMVAAELRRAQMGTLLLDLLTPQEDQQYITRFNIALLTERLEAAIAWLKQNTRTGALSIGLFGASTGAAAALLAAANSANDIAAVVTRGGRPDLAPKHMLARVRAPTLLIVGGDDDTVVDLNRAAFAELRCEKRLEIIPGASHLFEESGKLEAVASFAVQWFGQHLQKHRDAHAH